VLVVASLHGAHRDHPAYRYEDLYSAIRAFAPDLVAVEIRQEDLDRGEEYLARNYPLEMRELARSWAPHVRGIDWLEAELEGRPVPDDWWSKQSEITRLQRALGEDPAVSTSEADRKQSEQMAMIGSASAAELNDGRYDALSRSYYALLARSLAGTPYSALSDFYAERDRRIAGNVASIVAENPGRRIAVVVGADHRGPVVRELETRFAGQVEMVPVR
jgi:hypothetical protein